MLTTILVVALTAQAAKTQAPTNEQQRLKALAAKIHQESLAKKPKAKTTTPKITPIIQYVEVAHVEPGSLLYVWNEDLERVPVCKSFSRLKSLQKSMLDDDQTAIDEAIARERLPHVPMGTPVKVIRTLESQSSVTLSTRTFARELQNAQSSKSSDTLLPACEIRILDGPFKGQSGWVPEYLLRDRVEVAVKKAKGRR